MNGPTDAHIHIANIGPEGSEHVRSCGKLFSCTARPDEWKAQMEISEKDARVFPFYGTHPWYCQEHDNRLLEDFLNECHDSGVGEIGLDFLKADRELQMDVFVMQLELAEEYERPVTIHMVRSEKETLDALRGFELKGMILHSFESASYAKPFGELGCFFSVSPRLLKKSDGKISNILNSIPMDRLLIESDLPDCKGSVAELISKVSSLLSVDEDELLNITVRNAHSVLQ